MIILRLLISHMFQSEFAKNATQCTVCMYDQTLTKLLQSIEFTPSKCIHRPPLTIVTIPVRYSI